MPRSETGFQIAANFTEDYAACMVVRCHCRAGVTPCIERFSKKVRLLCCHGFVILKVLRRNDEQM